MYSIDTVIGEHRIRLTTESADFYGRLSGTLAAPLPVAGNKIDLEIGIEDGFGGHFQGDEVTVSSDEHFIYFGRTDYLIRVDRRFAEARLLVRDDFSLKHALLNLYGAFIVYHRWGVLLQSSCVVERGKAYVFAGKPGTGKSTIVRLSAPRAVLSDEITLLHIGEGSTAVYDSPFRSDRKSSGQSRVYPLGRVMVLQQSTGNRLSELKKSDGIICILDHLFHWSHDRTEMRKLLEMCRDLVLRTTVSRLYFENNESFWEVVP